MSTLSRPSRRDNLYLRSSLRRKLTLFTSDKPQGNGQIRQNKPRTDNKTALFSSYPSKNLQKENKEAKKIRDALDQQYQTISSPLKALSREAVSASKDDNRDSLRKNLFKFESSLQDALLKSRNNRHPYITNPLVSDQHKENDEKKSTSQKPKINNAASRVDAKLKAAVTALPNENNFNKRKLKKKRKGIPNNAKNPATSGKILSKEEQKERLLLAAKQREQRIIETKNRKQVIEKERMQSLIANRSDNRRQRMKLESQQTRDKMYATKVFLRYVILTARTVSITEFIVGYKKQKDYNRLRQNAAFIITRNVRMYCYRTYRQKIRRAFSVISSVLVIRIRGWKQIRRKSAADTITQFLLSLEEENERTGGCLSLIAKVKKWKVYKAKIIFIQRHWRQKLAIVKTQVILIDLQWQKLQIKHTNLEVERNYMLEESKINSENDTIRIVNKTRKLMKMRLIPRLKRRSIETIRKEILDQCQKDILNINHITPIEIRHKIIRECLKYMKCLFIQDMQAYRFQYATYKIELIQNQGLNLYEVPWKRDKKTAEKLSQNKAVRKCGSAFLKDINLKAPVKPFFRPLLREKSLKTMAQLGKKVVLKIRNVWRPSNISNRALPDYKAIGKQVAICQYEEINLRIPLENDGEYL